MDLINHWFIRPPKPSSRSPPINNQFIHPFKQLVIHASIQLGLHPLVEPFLNVASILPQPTHCSAHQPDPRQAISDKGSVNFKKMKKGPTLLNHFV